MNPELQNIPSQIYRKGIVIMFGMVPFNMRHDLAQEEDEFSRLFNWMNRPLSSLFNDTGWSAPSSFSVDVKDNGKSFELKADLPGLTKDDINLSYKDNYITIAARKEHAKDEKDDNGNYIRRERYSGSMSRSFYIDNIDEANCTAEFKDGILTVTMPKKELAPQETPQQIPIHVPNE